MTHAGACHFPQAEERVPERPLRRGEDGRQAETGTLPFHLGPAWYIERLDTKIEKGDQLEIKGSRVTFEGKPAIIAAEVTKGDSVLVLRNAFGVPAWAGWRKR